MNFRELRKKANLSVKDVAEKLGISSTSIYSYETSLRLPTVSILSQMARIYHVSMEEITLVYNYHKAKKNGELTFEEQIAELLEPLPCMDKLAILDNVKKTLKVG